MARILILWNQIDDDVYEHFRRDDKRAPEWDPTLTVEPWDTVEEEMQLIVRALEGGGHSVVVVNIRDDFRALLAAIERERPDLIMNLVEFFGDDPEHEHHVPGVYELLGISYTGNRPLVLSLCQKKPQAKAVLAAHDIATPRGIVVTGAVPRELALRFPLIVKPAYDDASGGIDAGSVVHDRPALEARAAQVLAEQRGAALIEEYIDGRELHVAILGDEALPVYEMAFKGGVDERGVPLPRVITYRAKWDPYSRDHHAIEGRCPVTDLAPEVLAEAQAIALRAYRALGCRDYARVDMRLDAATGGLFVLEVNPNPDLAATCAFATAAAVAGRDYPTLICEIIGLALQRSRAPAVRASFDQLLHEYQQARAAKV